MEKKISLLDCTLRDGCYIVNAEFGEPAIKGIIRKMEDAGAEIIECGWLKDSEYKQGTTFFHVPSDLEKYLEDTKKRAIYAVMIDWDRYDVDKLPPCDGKSVDAIRIVFPYGKHKEGIQVGMRIKEKGYKVYYQAANTLAYSNEDLVDLAKCINEADPVCLSVVDTFGAMYEDDLDRIVEVLDKNLDPKIKLGFHSHNNQQLSFALTIHFIRKLGKSSRSIVVDSSLCGMGRGAGNATTELVVSYLNRAEHRNYDMDAVLDAIDTYMPYFLENFEWGYSTPYFIAGMYCCHVNNIAYLLKNHRTNSKDMRGIIESLSPDERKKYDYDLLEAKYIQNQNRKVDDSIALEQLRQSIQNKSVLLLAPGKSLNLEKEKIDRYIQQQKPVIIEVNAVSPDYKGDYLFLINKIRYDYASSTYPREFAQMKKILLSNVKTEGDAGELVVNFSRVNKMGWKYFDNAVIDCLRLLDRLGVEKVAVAGFDGFMTHYNETYADKSLPTLVEKDWDALNKEIGDMFADFKQTADSVTEVEFITKSIFDCSK